MDFGKLTNVETVDFTLPADHPDTARFLASRTASREDGGARDQARAPRVLLGCPRWADRGFRGRIYPPKTKQAEQLAAYAKSFDTIELNTTFYGVREELVGRWKAQVPGRFRFCPKIPKAISHHRQLQNAEGEMERFVRAVSAFGDRLGPSWILLPPGFRPAQHGALRAFLDRWSAELELAVELRHEEWFAPANTSLLQETFAHFEETGTTAILTDVAGRRDVLHQRLTANRAIVRFVGNRLHATDYARVDAWSERLAAWLDRGLGSVYLWLHQPEEALNVEIAERFATSLEARGIGARKPVRYDTKVQGELF
ncbi:MAG: DUF72 domain-containing protein [Gemmatimonadetes bacterium]|nr:DUF72 domain-containing protein [Gemmatimonadota bacterium]